MDLQDRGTGLWKNGWCFISGEIVQCPAAWDPTRNIWIPASRSNPPDAIVEFQCLRVHKADAFTHPLYGQARDAHWHLLGYSIDFRSRRSQKY
ncbi:hypothetical protein M422DRAFT_263302 [Sphaerobolus stellatus SS14]|uniref:Unplaced genomic scaffold SPHSTscaffold_123, whole genome shotgun sequence n=1 Tax=Sphaerobolus stellatus (strain SS14) TaxID=990650 RepID=A0A0C9VAL0_SPHS4|nr:hypothetical protein M422DRAFT_263302 [Sphaerobolus stellatus SS14]